MQVSKSKYHKVTVVILMKHLVHYKKMRAHKVRWNFPKILIWGRITYFSNYLGRITESLEGYLPLALLGAVTQPF